MTVGDARGLIKAQLPKGERPATVEESAIAIGSLVLVELAAIRGTLEELRGDVGLIGERVLAAPSERSDFDRALDIEEAG